MILIGIRIVFGLFFIFTGGVKMMDLMTFRDSVLMFNILPLRFVNFVTITIPSVEFLCGLLITIGIFKRVSFSLLISLTILFIVAISIALYQGKSFECGCFGPLKLFDKISWISIFFDCVLLTGSLLLYFKNGSQLNVLKQSKFVFITLLFTALMAQIPFSNTNLKYSLNAQKIKEIDWQTAFTMMKEQNAVLFDARSVQKYKIQHVMKSLSLPLSQFDTYIAKYDSLNLNEPVIVYCDNNICGTSRRTGYRLVFHGYTNVYIVKEGIEGLLRSDIERINKVKPNNRNGKQ